MNIFFDTEFTGLHSNTTLISIGLVSENGKKFYAEFNDYDKNQVNDWIQKNIIEKLKFRACVNAGKQFKVLKDDLTEVCGDTNFIRKHLDAWLESFKEDIQLISDVCHYDMVLFIKLYGDEALFVPPHISPVCHDINQDIASYFGIPEKNAFDLSREEIIKGSMLLSQEDKHNALFDALVIKEVHERLNKPDFLSLNKEENV